jgi:hypothetical protein
VSKHQLPREQSVGDLNMAIQMDNNFLYSRLIICEGNGHYQVFDKYNRNNDLNTVFTLHTELRTHRLQLPGFQRLICHSAIVEDYLGHMWFGLERP